MKIFVKVKPSAREDKVAGWLGDVVKVELKQKPVDGKANVALIKFVAEKLGIFEGNLARLV